MAQKKDSKLWAGPLRQAAMELRKQIKDEWTIKTRLAKALAIYRIEKPEILKIEENRQHTGK